jgi:hypothetical protein
MAYDLDDFCADASRALDADPGTRGRLALRGFLEKLLANRDFIARHLGPDEPSGVKRLYEDPKGRFLVLGHINRKPSNNSAHDHGPSWAVYGMAMNFTDMTEYRRVDGGGDDAPAVLEKTKEYRLNEGQAVLFDTGVIHSLRRALETRLVRVTGGDLDAMVRRRYNLETGRVTRMEPTAEASRRAMDAA